MSVLRLGGRVEQAFPVDYPPEVAFRYFAGNHELLEQFLGAGRVEALSPGVYRVALKPHGALGLSLRPSFDVQFVEFPFERVEMRSLGASLLEASHDNTDFEATFLGEARFECHPQGCEVRCWAEMGVELVLPPLLGWMPSEALERIGNGVIQPAMHMLSTRLVPLMQRDIHRWVAEQGGIEAIAERE